MISSAPFKRLLVEKEIDIATLSKVTKLPMCRFEELYRSGKASCKTIDAICRALRCQPCDIIEFSKTIKKGHWEFITEEEC